MVSGGVFLSVPFWERLVAKELVALLIVRVSCKALERKRVK